MLFTIRPYRRFHFQCSERYDEKSLAQHPYACSRGRHSIVRVQYPAKKDAFVLLMTVSGIGPKSALGILSALPVSDLVSAIQSGDVERLETVPGIGKKSAGRLVLELKDKLTKLHPALPRGVESMVTTGQDEIFDDALSALTNLGYRASDGKEALKRVRKRSGSLSLQELIRETLKDLARR